MNKHWLDQNYMMITVIYLPIHLFIVCIGDEIFSINGRAVQGMTHQEAISLFKEVKQGELVLTIGRRSSTSNINSSTNPNDETNGPERPSSTMCNKKNSVSTIKDII